MAKISADADYGIITGEDCYPANIRERDIVLQHIKRQIENTGFEINNLGLDAGYMSALFIEAVNCLASKATVVLEDYTTTLCVAKGPKVIFGIPALLPAPTRRLC